MNLGPGSMSSFTRVLEIRFSRGPFALARTWSSCSRFTKPSTSDEKWCREIASFTAVQLDVFTGIAKSKSVTIEDSLPGDVSAWAVCAGMARRHSHRRTTGISRNPFLGWRV